MSACLTTQAPLDEGLYPGEKMMYGNGFPALTYFEKGQKDKPLVIFVPGDAHLARISYGIEGSKKEDFLAYWLVDKGYSFLGVSYPMDNPVYKGATVPAFSIQDWGKQVAEIAKKVLNENPELSKHIVVVGWSMGGSIAEPIAVAAKANGLAIDCFIALDAVPGNPYIMQSGAFSPSKQLANGLADRTPLFGWFIEALIEQNKLNGHEIISEDLYKKEYLGNIPVNIEASEIRYDSITGKFIKSPGAAIVDSGVFGREGNFPIVGVITSTDPENYRISLTNQAEWDRIAAFRLAVLLPPDKLNPVEYQKYRKLLVNLHTLLSREVDGNHFFFLGEKGAKETATQIESILETVKKAEHEFQKLIKYKSYI